ncbi:hypothetical protein CBM2592_B40117 [Cupriavidus taiwanensis]|nr:hypothetical protein CBM2592_B40117 [Cupriavidus taiwanensis]SPA20959.1 hypothetical protein CBM2631_B50071 [Cupriavidus taiwanensis]
MLSNGDSRRGKQYSAASGSHAVHSNRDSIHRDLRMPLDDWKRPLTSRANNHVSHASPSSSV